jgi:hypothetical protein
MSTTISTLQQAIETAQVMKNSGIRRMPALNSLVQTFPQAALTAIETVYAAVAPAADVVATPAVAETDSKYQDYYNYVSSIGREGDTLCFVAIEHNLDGIRNDEVVINEFVSFEEALTRASFDVLTGANNRASKNPRNTMSSIYLATNTFPKDLIGKRVGRTQDNVVEVRALQADVDKNGAVTMNAIQSSDSVPPPSIVVESSTGKFQGIWLVDGFQKDEAKAVMKAMAAQFETDSAVADTARVMRVPGFVNRKYESAPVARTVSQSNARYNRDKFTISAPVAKFEKRPENWVNDVVITHGSAHTDLLSVAGYFIKEKNVNDPEMLYRILASYCENAVEADGITPWQPNMKEVREKANNWVEQFETNDEIRSRTDLKLNMVPTPGSPAAEQEAAWAREAVASANFQSLTTKEALSESKDSWLFSHIPVPSKTPHQELVWLLDEMLLEGGLHQFSGKWGSMKSMLLVILSECLCNGKPFAERVNVGRKIPVVYIDKENPPAEVERRLRALGLYELDNFRAWGDWSDNAPPRSPDDPRLMECAYRERPFFIFDSLSSFLNGAKENATEEMMIIMDKARTLARASSGVAFLHHPTKNGPDGGRGSGSIVASTDMAFVVKKAGNTVSISAERFRMCAPYTIQLELDFGQGKGAKYGYRIIQNGYTKERSQADLKKEYEENERLKQTQADDVLVQRALVEIAGAWKRGVELNQTSLGGLLGLKRGKRLTELLSGSPDRPWVCLPSGNRNGLLYYPKEAVLADGTVVHYQPVLAAS